MVVIVGCNHGIQSERKDALDGAYTREQVNDANSQRNYFRNLLHRFINEEKPEIIAEEWGPADKTFAQIIANESGLRYVEVNTNRKEREQLGIPEDYLDGSYSADQRAEWQENREEVMFAKIQHARQTASTILVVCGFNHIAGFSNLFRAASDEVKVKDYRDEPWYRQGNFVE